MAVTTDEIGRYRALSVLSQCQAHGGLRADIHFYGGHMQDLHGHIRYQARRVIDVWPNGDVFLVVHVPMEIDTSGVREIMTGYSNNGQTVETREMWLWERLVW